MKTYETICSLKALQGKNPVRFYYTGGFVRDMLKQIPPKDVDIIAVGIDEIDLFEFLKQSGEILLVGAQFGTYMFRSDKSNDFVEISMPRKERSIGPGHRDFEIVTAPDISLEEDSGRRDFTINSMYLPLEYKALDEVIDYQRGQSDLKYNRVKFVGDPTRRVLEDPLRIMRVFSLASKGYIVHKSVKDTVAAFSYLLERVSVERIRLELEKVLLSNKPSRTIRLMSKLKVLEVVLPELAACVGITQSSKYHKFDVFSHCIFACDNTPKDLVLRLAALLHDIGKPKVRELKEGHYTFYNHEIVSEKVARNVLERLKFSSKIIEEVCFLISNHMFHYDRQWTNKAVRRFIKQTGMTKEVADGDIESFPLFVLRKADRLGSGFKTIPITQRQKDFQKRIKRVLEESSVLRITDMAVNGLDIMENFNLKPTPLVGEVLRILFDIVLEKPFLNNRADLLREAERIIQGINDESV